MSLRKLVSILVFTALGVSSLPAQAPLPRKSPEFTITEPSGTQLLLSNFKGKVVVIEFLFVRSPHCLSLAQMLGRLQDELGSRGFQSLAVAFGPDADESVVNQIAQHLKLTYPVGYTSSGKVDAYLGREGSVKLKIPQMVVIDRKGVIRAATGTGADATLEDEGPLRNLVDSLLKETVSSSSPARTAPAPKSRSQP
jgi:peroxiredoxin